MISITLWLSVEYYLQTSMQRSQLRRDSSNRSLSPSRSHANIKSLYFCHYKNGMYMGSVDCFQKNGFGIILHDNGSSMLSSCYKDMLHGDNVVYFSNGAGLSAKYFKDKLTEVLYRNNNVMFYARYKNGYPEGGAILVRWKEEIIEYISYRSGLIYAKSYEENREVLVRIFKQKRYNELIPQKHLMNLEMEGSFHSEISICKKAGKILVGFSKENSMINGLGFVLLTKSSFNRELEVEILERGFYKNSQLSGFGQRNFKNGNNYIGEFKYDQFEGTGVLKNIHKHNWVSGSFEKGSLVELLTYGNVGEQRSVNKVIESIHESQTTWVNKQLVVPSQLAIEKEILAILEFKGDTSNRGLERKRTDVLRRIQDNFITSCEEGNSGSMEHQSSKKVSFIDQKHFKSPNSPQSSGSFGNNQNHHHYSFIQQNQAMLSSQSRRNFFDSSPRLLSPSNDKFNPKSSFRLQLQPVPMDTPKQIQSRLLLKQPQPHFSHKSSKQTKTPTKSPSRSKKGQNTNPNNSTNKSSTMNRSKSALNINSIKLIDSMYKKNFKSKLF